MKLLFVTSEDRKSTEGFHWCLHKAKETGGEVFLTYVGDENQTSKDFLEEARKQGVTFQVKLQTELAHGAYIENCIGQANKLGVDALVAVEQKKSFFNRIFSSSDMEGLKDKIHCELKIY